MADKLAPIATVPPNFPNYMGANNTSTPYPPGVKYTSDPNQASWGTVYAPANFADGTYRQPWTQNATTEGFIVYAPNQPLGTKPITRFNGISVDNMDVGSVTATMALNGVNRLNNMVDAQVAYNIGVSPLDPLSFLYSDPTKGGLPNVNSDGKTPLEAPTFPAPAPA
jgi:hypothetical protein